LYLRRLERLSEKGIEKVSSRDLADLLHITAAQLRKDLAYFGQFGRPGVGYRIRPLIDELRRIFGTDQIRRVAVVGIGDLGSALLHYRVFRKRRFDLTAAFDIAPAKIGRQVGQVTIQHINELHKVVRANDIKLAIIATPAEAAQQVADMLCEAGIKGILNFAPTTLQTPPDVAVKPVDLASSLEQLSFQVHAQR
jgi:redox-sensing transcriptional repressor